MAAKMWGWEVSIGKPSKNLYWHNFALIMLWVMGVWIPLDAGSLLTLFAPLLGPLTTLQLPRTHLPPVSGPLTRAQK
jgi:hypothetical protein